MRGRSEPSTWATTAASACSTSEATRTWDVFDAEGRLLGAAQLPPRFTPLRTHGDAVYGVERDELGVNHVLRVRVGW